MNMDHITSEEGAVATSLGRPDRHASRTGMNFATFDTVAHAEALKDFLNRHGIDAHVQDERRLQRFWFLTKPGAGLHVRVPEPSFARAEELLGADQDFAVLMKQAIRCPSCQSFQVQFPSMTRNFILPTLIAQLGVWLGFMQREYFCEKCQFTWIQPRRGIPSARPVKVSALFPGRLK